MKTSMTGTNHLFHNNLVFVDLAQKIGPGQEIIYAPCVRITVRQSATVASGAFDSFSSSYLSMSCLVLFSSPDI